jgi:hypothetical protein
MRCDGLASERSSRMASNLYCHHLPGDAIPAGEFPTSAKRRMRAVGQHAAIWEIQGRSR